MIAQLFNSLLWPLTIAVSMLGLGLMLGWLANENWGGKSYEKTRLLTAEREVEILRRQLERFKRKEENVITLPVDIQVERFGGRRRA